MQWSDYLDILIVAVLIYKLFPLIKGSSITRIAKFIVFVLIVAWLADALDLHTFGFIINSFLEIGIIALIAAIICIVISKKSKKVSDDNSDSDYILEEQVEKGLTFFTSKKEDTFIEKPQNKEE
jgi:DNA integrity scanning protein DisA with diadenylate cyclase activity